MQVRQYVKLLALFVGAHLFIQSLSVVLSLPRFGQSDSLFVNGLWLYPLIALLVAVLLFVYASYMKLQDQGGAKEIFSGVIKLYGLFMLITGCEMIIAGLFTPGLFSSSLKPVSEIDQTHLIVRPFLTGGLKVVLSLVFIFKTETVVRILKVRGNA